MENQEFNILDRIMSKPIFSVKCRLCKDVLKSKFSGDYKKCKCERIAIDGGKNKNQRRFIGDLQDVEE